MQSPFVSQAPTPYRQAILAAAGAIGAMPSDISGLWSAPGYPELTTAQMLVEANRLMANSWPLKLKE